MKVSSKKPMDTPRTRTTTVWMSYLIIVAVTFIPLAYKANGINEEITKQVLYIFAGLTVSFDVLGFVHRKLTEKLKEKEKSQ